MRVIDRQTDGSIIDRFLYTPQKLCVCVGGGIFVLSPINYIYVLTRDVLLVEVDDMPHHFCPIYSVL